MGSLELVIALKLISVDLGDGLGELTNTPTKAGPCRIAGDAQPYLSTLSSNRPEDGERSFDGVLRPRCLLSSVVACALD